jgi:hypothetical protein
MRLDIVKLKIKKYKAIQRNTAEEFEDALNQHYEEGYEPLEWSYTKKHRELTQIEINNEVTGSVYRYGVIVAPRHRTWLKFKLWYKLHKEAVKKLIKTEFELIGFLKRFK